MGALRYRPTALGSPSPTPPYHQCAIESPFSPAGWVAGFAGRLLGTGSSELLGVRDAPSKLSGAFQNFRMTWRDSRDLGATKAFPCTTA